MKRVPRDGRVRVGQLWCQEYGDGVRESLLVTDIKNTYAQFNGRADDLLFVDSMLDNEYDWIYLLQEAPE